MKACLAVIEPDLQEIDRVHYAIDKFMSLPNSDN